MARNSKTPSRKQVEKEFAVIGLGRFGGSLARRLEGMGHTVLGVDSDMARCRRSPTTSLRQSPWMRPLKMRSRRSTSPPSAP